MTVTTAENRLLNNIKIKKKTHDIHYKREQISKCQYKT